MTLARTTTHAIVAVIVASSSVLITPAFAADQPASAPEPEMAPAQPTAPASTTQEAKAPAPAAAAPIAAGLPVSIDPMPNIPANAPAGDLVRTIRVWSGWTTICDEILSIRRRDCQAIQNVADDHGNVILSVKLKIGEAGNTIELQSIPIRAGTALSAQGTTIGQITATTQRCNDRSCLYAMEFTAALQSYLLSGNSLKVLVPSTALSGQQVYQTTIQGAGLAPAIASISLTRLPTLAAVVTPAGKEKHKAQ
jgi:invasion protein IalB